MPAPWEHQERQMPNHAGGEGGICYTFVLIDTYLVFYKVFSNLVKHFKTCSNKAMLGENFKHIIQHHPT